MNTMSFLRGMVFKKCKTCPYRLNKVVFVRCPCSECIRRGDSFLKDMQKQMPNPTGEIKNLSLHGDRFSSFKEGQTQDEIKVEERETFE